MSTDSIIFVHEVRQALEIMLMITYIKYLIVNSFSIDSSLHAQSYCDIDVNS